MAQTERTHESRIAELERQLTELRKSVETMQYQSNSQASTLVTVLERIDGLHGDLRDLKDLLMTAAPRVEVDHRIDDLKSRVDSLEGRFMELSTNTYKAIVSIQSGVNKSKNATYLLLVTVVITVAGWFVTPGVTAWWENTVHKPAQVEVTK